MADRGVPDWLHSASDAAFKRTGQTWLRGHQRGKDVLSKLILSHDSCCCLLVINWSAHQKGTWMMQLRKPKRAQAGPAAVHHTVKQQTDRRGEKQQWYAI
jgi:hypothetical protein